MSDSSIPTPTPASPGPERTADALASLYDAGAVHVPPHLALAAAVATGGAGSIGAAIDWLVSQRDALEQAYQRGHAAPLALATLPAEMCYQPELGFLDRARRDHGLRERYLFAEIVGRRSFTQTAVYAMTGLELSPHDAELFDRVGTINLQADRGAWPLAVTRRVAARGGGYASAVAAGTAMMGARLLAGEAAASCARYLRRVQEQVAAGQPVAEVVAETLARKERVMGFGRPVVGPDERVPPMRAALAEHGRDGLPFARLLDEVEQAFAAQKGLRTTSAAWAAAMLCDFGLSPDCVQAVSNFWVTVCVYSQATYAGERGLVAR